MRKIYKLIEINGTRTHISAVAPLTVERAPGMFPHIYDAEAREDNGVIYIAGRERIAGRAPRETWKLYRVEVLS